MRAWLVVLIVYVRALQAVKCGNTTHHLAMYNETFTQCTAILCASFGIFLPFASAVNCELGALDYGSVLSRDSAALSFSIAKDSISEHSTCFQCHHDVPCVGKAVFCPSCRLLSILALSGILASFWRRLVAVLFAGVCLELS